MEVGSPPANTEAGQSLLYAPSARRALAGLCLSGLLASLLGAILPAWGYHLKFEFATVGHYFLSFGVGVLLSVALVLLGHRFFEPGVSTDDLPHGARRSQT